MKAASLMLATIGCAVFIHGTSYAFLPNPASQEQSSESSTMSRGSDKSGNATSGENGKRLKIGTHSDERRTQRHISGQKRPPSYASLTKLNRPRPFRNARERSRPINALNGRQPGSSKPAGATKFATHRNQWFRTPETDALGGQQLRNGHNRASGTATIGGRVNPPRNTAAINGTGINPRH